MRLSLVLSFLAVALATATPGGAHTKPTPCADGRFLQATTIIGSSPGAAFDAVTLSASTLAIASGCDPAAVKLKASKKQTAIHAKWASCGELTNVRLSGAIKSNAGVACSLLKAVVRAKKHKPIKVSATRSTCGDGRVDTVAGESCDPPASGSCSATCQTIATLTPQQWNWVPIDGAICANGAPTGIGVNPGTSHRMAIYLMGGGACWDATTCYSLQTAANISSGYGASAFASDAAGLLTSGFFDRTDATNPFKDDTLVFVPYCTGDVHAGSADQVWDGHPTHHVGFVNMTKDLAWLVPQFPNTTRVVLAGSSAGGFGALTNWWQTQQAFGSVRVDMIDDSGPPLPAPYASTTLENTWRDAWNLAAAVPPGCSACSTDLHAIFAFYAAQFPDHRGALLSYYTDTVIPLFYQISGMQFQQAILALTTDILTHDIYRAFVVDASGHVIFYPGSTQNGVTLREFVTKMLSDDPTWTSELPM